MLDPVTNDDSSFSRATARLTLPDTYGRKSTYLTLTSISDQPTIVTFNNNLTNNFFCAICQHISKCSSGSNFYIGSIIYVYVKLLKEVIFHRKLFFYVYVNLLPVVIFLTGFFFRIRKSASGSYFLPEVIFLRIYKSDSVSNFLPENVITYTLICFRK